jgi:hypothetical protein
LLSEKVLFYYSKYKISDHYEIKNTKAEKKFSPKMETKSHAGSKNVLGFGRLRASALRAPSF